MPSKSRSVIPPQATRTKSLLINRLEMKKQKSGPSKGRFFCFWVWLSSPALPLCMRKSMQKADCRLERFRFCRCLDAGFAREAVGLMLFEQARLIYRQLVGASVECDVL